MNVVDIICLALIILGAIVGFKNGAIKSIVSLVGFVAIIILAYQFKGLLANIFIRKLPFFNFGGILNELYSINILVYEGISFVIIFILLYCILNIIIGISGILEFLLKLTIILEIPSKIIGAILGAVEGIFFVFLVSVIMMQFGQTQKYIMESNVARTIVERTPIATNVFKQTIAASEDIYRAVDSHKEDTNKLDANLEIIRALIKYGIVDAKDIQSAIDNGKLHMENVVVAS